MRLRALVPVVLLLAPVLAGCFDADDGPRLAQPTDKPAGPSPPPSPTPETVVLDYNDPGYRMADATPWKVGDGWDWESDKGRFRTMRVVESRNVSGATHWRIEETAGRTGNPPDGRSTSWVNGSSWMRVNTTDVLGGLTTFRPGIPLRHTWNGSYNYTEQRHDAQGRRLENFSVYANVAYVNNDVVLRLHWGAQVATAKFDHRILTVDKDRAQTRTLLTKWVSRDYANDVQWRVNDETFVRVAAKVGGRVIRELRAT